MYFTESSKESSSHSIIGNDRKTINNTKPNLRNLQDPSFVSNCLKLTYFIVFLHISPTTDGFKRKITQIKSKFISFEHK